MHTPDDAQQLVELQDEKRLEAWRQLVIRYDPIGESYVFDQMSALMEVPRSMNLVELPAAITRSERSLRAYAEKTGGAAAPPEWKLPIFLLMIPKDMIQEIKIRHKCTVGESKGYDGFSRILIELANEKVYDRRAASRRGENDMDTDLVDPEARGPPRAFRTDEHPDYTERELID